MSILDLNRADHLQSKAVPLHITLSDDFKFALDLLPNLIWVSHTNSGYCNLALKQYIGADTQILRDVDWLKFVHPDDAEHLYQIWNDAQKNGQKFEKECRIKNKSGEYFWFLMLAEPKVIQSNQQNWMISCTNIHDRTIKMRETAEALRANTDMLDVSVDCIKIITPDGKLEHMNKSGCMALLGQERVKKFGMDWLTLLPPEVREQGAKAIKTAARGKNARFAGMSTHGDTVMYWDNILTPVHDEQGNTTSILCVSRDITRQRVAEAKLKISSEYDDLTGLMNRRAFKNKLKTAISQANREKTLIGMMFIDLDHFKNINDTLGHPAGDHLLKVLSKRLQKSLDRKCIVSRLGGDEFAIIVTGMTSEEELHQTTQKVLKQNIAPITYAGKVINSGMSIGCAIYPKDAQDVFGLMKCADTALNDLKEKGRGGYRMYDNEMFALAEKKMQQLDTARYIIQDNLIEPYYQPKVRLDNCQLIGFEALMRWHDAQQQLHYPASISEAFNDYELASKISEIMHEKILSDMADWMSKGVQLVPISINASPVEFMRDNYAELLIQRLERHQIPAHLIEVEITEHILSERGIEFVIRALQKLKNYGLRISLDDFGTGHSSMTHLRDYPVDCLKIDYAFVNRMNEEKSINSIVEGIAKLGPILSLDVIAEGVETCQQLLSLQDVGCAYGQGFLFSQAICKSEAEQLMLKQICAIKDWLPIDKQ